MKDSKIIKMAKECDHLIGTEFTLSGDYGSQYFPAYLSDMETESIEHIGTRYDYCPFCGMKLEQIYQYLEERDGHKYEVKFKDVLSPYQPETYVPYWGNKTKLEDWYGMYIDNKYRILEAFQGKDMHKEDVVIFTCHDGKKIVELRYNMNEAITIYSVRREYDV